MHDVNSVHEIEFSRRNPLLAPRQIEIDGRPFQREVRVLRRQFALIAAPEIRVWFGNDIAFKSRQKVAFTE